jgi:hypothetical protein
MTARDFAATAVYFERRARKAASKVRRRQLEDAAKHYRRMAEQVGPPNAPEITPSSLAADIPERRRRLMELFRAYHSDQDAI